MGNKQNDSVKRKVVDNETQTHGYSEGIKELYLVDLPKGGHIKEIIVRHYLSYDFPTTKFKKVILPKDGIIEYLENLLK